MFYKHFKGGLYYVLGVIKEDTKVDESKAGKFIEARHSEDGNIVNVFMYDGGFHANTDEKLTLYLGASGDFWVRPSDMFLGTTNHENAIVRRFTPYNSIAKNYI